jgi:hypothetical protein
MVRVPPTINEYLYNGQQMNQSEMDFETTHSPIIISDDDNDDNNNRNNRNTRNNHVIVIISDDEEEDIYSIPAKQYYNSIKPGIEMVDQLDDSDGEEDDSIATIDPPEELETMYLKGKTKMTSFYQNAFYTDFLYYFLNIGGNDISTRQPPHSTRSLKRPREHIVIEEVSQNETTRDDSSSSNNMMKDYPWWQLNGGQPSR